MYGFEKVITIKSTFFLFCSVRTRRHHCSAGSASSLPLLAVATGCYRKDMWRLHVLLLVAAIGACSLFSLAQAFSFLPPHASSPTTPSSCHWLARAPRRFTKVGSAPATQETGLEGEKVEERSGKPSFQTQSFSKRGIDIRLQ